MSASFSCLDTLDVSATHFLVRTKFVGYLPSRFPNSSRQEATTSAEPGVFFLSRQARLELSTSWRVRSSTRTGQGFLRQLRREPLHVLIAFPMYYLLCNRHHRELLRRDTVTIHVGELAIPNRQPHQET